MKKAILFIIINFIFLFCLTYYFNLSVKQDIAVLENTKASSKYVNNELDYIQNENNKLAKDIDELNINLEKIRVENNKYKIEIEFFKEEIEKLKKQTPEHIKLKYEALNILNRIQVLANNNQHFTNEIDELKLLANGNLNLLEVIDNLKEYNLNIINLDIIFKDFKLESNNNSLFIEDDKNDTRLKQILSNVVKIKKLKNKEERNKINEKINELEKMINLLQFEEAIKFINTEFAGSFEKTKINLSKKLGFNHLLYKITYSF